MGRQSESALRSIYTCRKKFDYLESERTKKYNGRIANRSTTTGCQQIRLEGCIGGVAGAALIGGLYAHFFVEAAFPDQIITWTIAFICAAGAVMSMVGDLAASAIKRNHNIKDYGKLIPGHGGIMDRFDSMTVTAPMTYFLAILMIGLR